MGVHKELVLVIEELEHYAERDLWDPALDHAGRGRRVFLDRGGRPIGEVHYDEAQPVSARWLLDPLALRPC